jgi:hypothetical protein
MIGVFANHKNHPMSANNFAAIAHFLHTCSDFHDFPPRAAVFLISKTLAALDSRTALSIWTNLRVAIPASKNNF